MPTSVFRKSLVNVSRYLRVDDGFEQVAFDRPCFCYSVCPDNAPQPEADCYLKKEKMHKTSHYVDYQLLTSQEVKNFNYFYEFYLVNVKNY